MTDQRILFEAEEYDRCSSTIYTARFRRKPLSHHSSNKQDKTSRVCASERFLNRERGPTIFSIVATENPEQGETRSGRLQVLLSSFWTSLGGVFGGRVDGQEEIEIEEELDLEMASEFVVPEQPIVAVSKQKNAQPEVRNRRVLRDIGNLVPAPAVVGKPKSQINRPTKAKAVAKNEAIVKKSGKSLTAILSARSKAAYKPKNLVDIDAADVENELAAVEYVEDMYSFYKQTEEDGSVGDYIDSQPEVNSKMRAILIDWLIEVHRKFELVPESLYLTVNIVDRFLASKNVVARRELQLAGISSMLIACKYEEIWAPEVSDFIAISDNAYVREQVLPMEKAILGKLEWYLTVPTPYVFLVRYVKASHPADKEMENMAFFYAELGLVDYTMMTRYSPSKLSASAVYVARCTLNRSPIWTDTLEHHTGYFEDQLMDCAKMLASLHSGGAENKLKAVHRKYSSPERGVVALFPPPSALLPLPL